MRTLSGAPMVGPAAWHGRELLTSTDWIRQLGRADVDELVEKARRCFDLTARDIGVG